VSTLAQLRDLRRRLAESDKLRSTVDHAADVAALDALHRAVDAFVSADAALSSHRDACSQCESAGPSFNGPCPVNFELEKRYASEHAVLTAILWGDL
jgi:hypothetical protein